MNTGTQLISHFYSVQNLNSWNGAVTVKVGLLPQLPSLKTPSQTCIEALFLGDLAFDKLTITINKVAFPLYSNTIFISILDIIRVAFTFHIPTRILFLNT